MYEFSLQNISKRLNEMPMAAIVVSLAVGILFSDAVALAVWVWVVVTLVALAVAVASKGVRTAAVMVAVFGFGGGIYAAEVAAPPIYGEPCEVVMRIVEPSVVGERYAATSAEVLTGEGVARGARLRLYSPPAVRFEEGDRVRAKIRLRAFDASRDGYGQTMFHRGFVGSGSLYPSQILDFEPCERHSLHTHAVERLRSMMEPSEARAVVLAMSTAHRAEIGAETYAAYSRTGASHLLAVSGLHVGILFLLINLVVWPLALLPHGNLVGGIIATAVVWGYVALCGFAPSAVRSAIMFTAMQLCVSAVRGYVSGNVLCATAFVMLVVNPDLVFDLSFRMSFAAVAGIIFWGVPVMRAVRIPYRALRALFDSVVIGVVASLWVLPLVSQTFGVVSIVGILISPALILVAYLLLGAALLALVLPAPLASLAVCVAEWAAALQNIVVGRCAEWRCAYIEYACSEQAVVGIYALFAAITLLRFGFRRRKESIFKDIS